MILLSSMLKKESFSLKDLKVYILISILVIILLLITVLLSNRRIRQIEDQRPRIGIIEFDESSLHPVI